MTKTQEENKSLALWKRWFEEDGSPWEYEKGCYCFFCYKDHPNHKDDCIYLAARELVEDE